MFYHSYPLLSYPAYYLLAVVVIIVILILSV
uniref:Uncharacterized protein n=1 Tax=Siphoviridae sp. ctqwY3 TaxID=2827951 RepID=A0A8S5S6G2_9CAUD|nr:MAG TPA: hypothetical protein [Siphoviridae sp. ctqwY3]